MILFNNQFLDSDRIMFSVFSPTLNYGNGVFETLRTYNQKIFKSKEHLDRLFVSAQEIGLNIKYSEAEVSEMLDKILNKFYEDYRDCKGYENNENKNSKPELKIKIIAIEEGILITAKELDFSEFQLKNLQKGGVKCKSFTSPRSMAQVKSISYLSSYFFHREAEKLGAYDALLCDQNQVVLEGAYSNFFWFEGDVLFTNPVSTFCSGIKGDKLSYPFLAGITRQTIISLIDKNSQFSLEFKTIKLPELKQVDEVFLTQTTKGIVPVYQIDDQLIGKNTADSRCFSKTSQLIKTFEEYANS